MSGTAFEVDGKPVHFSSTADPESIPWAVDIVLECTGKLKSKEDMEVFLLHGAKKVVVSRPVESVLNVVVGVNDDKYDTAQDHIVTAASCTTNCLAPIVAVMREAFLIKHAVITTVHNVTNTQVVCDLPMSDLRRARSCLHSLVPTTTGSAKAIGLIFPDLKGKINGLAIRVPILNASITDVVFELAEAATREQINDALKRASESGRLVGILGYEERPLVSVDFKGDARSAIIDASSTLVVDGTSVKILAWYDNEWGYSNRMAELTTQIIERL